jgi:hypothetical protein
LTPLSYEKRKAIAEKFDAQDFKHVTVKLDGTHSLTTFERRRSDWVCYKFNYAAAFNTIVSCFHVIRYYTVILISISLYMKVAMLPNHRWAWASTSGYFARHTDIPLLEANMDNFAATFDSRDVTVADMLFDSFFWSNDDNKWGKHA